MDLAGLIPGWNKWTHLQQMLWLRPRSSGPRSGSVVCPSPWCCWALALSSHSISVWGLPLGWLRHPYYKKGSGSTQSLQTLQNPSPCIKAQQFWESSARTWLQAGLCLIATLSCFFPFPKLLPLIIVDFSWAFPSTVCIMKALLLGNSV